MSGADYLATLPLLVLAGATVTLLLVVSFRRSHALAAWLTTIAFGASLAAVPFSLPELPREVTPLLWLDRYAVFLGALFAAAGLVTVLFSRRYLEGRRGDLEEYYVLVATATIGAMTMSAAAHFASFLLGLEILTISLYGLIGYPEERHTPLEAALKYLVLSGVASTTLLFGMALIYLDTGTLTFAGLGRTLREEMPASLYLIVGNALLLAGIAFKLSLVPFHMWTPDVYEGAPAPVTGYLATVGKGAMFALALRYVVDSAALQSATLFFAVSTVAVLSMIAGNLLALLQHNVKRILAYSSIAHLGYLLIALLVVSSADAVLGVETALVYLTTYFAMTLAAFGVVAVASSPSQGRDADTLADFEGLFWQRPALAASFAVVLLSLAGIPMTLGFIAKFYLFAAGVEGALWALIWALIVGSGIGLFYYLRIIFAMTLQPDAHTEGRGAIGSRVDRGTVIALTLFLIAFGVYPTPLIDVVRAAVLSIGATAGQLVGPS